MKYKTLTLQQAVHRAVDECIKEGILREFLLKNKAEVISMSIYEYDEEQYSIDEICQRLRMEREDVIKVVEHLSEM